jgi:hypothetical protein
VKDALGATSTGCAITINLKLSVTCAPVSVGEVGVAFNSGPMTVSGGTTPYTFSIVGTLPAGLSLNPSTGAVSGTPTASGSFSVQVKDALGATSTGCAITINPALSVTCAAVSVGEVGVAFNSGPMTVTGGTKPYTFSIVGTLPAGLTLNTTNGAITGTPTASGSFSIQVKDASGAVGTGCAITINPPLSVTCPKTNTFTVGVPFNSGPVTVTGGTKPYTFSIVGTLPAGLTLNTSTGAVTGTPTASGSFSIQVKDASGATSTTACPVSGTTPCLASVCGFVFADCDGDGFLTPGFDSGMSNILVILKNSKNVAVATNRTSLDGSYCFYNLAPGTYTVCVNQPTNHVQTGGTHNNHWLNNNYQQCWNENDGYQHCKGADGVDRWTANDGCQHWKDLNNQDCWKDKYGYSHSQNCNYTSCDAPKGSCETFTLTACQALTSVNFAYQGILVKPVVCVTGPSKGICGKTGTYTCTVTNSGTACIPICQVTVCGKTYKCPSLSPGQGCSFKFDYQFQNSDYGNFNCKATANCNTQSSNSSPNFYNYYNYCNYYYGYSSTSCTAQGSCSTSVGYR